MLHFLGYLRGGGGLMPLISIEGGAQQDRFVEGAQAVSLRMAEALGARVRLSAPARRIAQDAEGVTVGTDAGDLRARRVIVAIPPPLCARIAFDPPLPGARDLLVQRASMGNTVKCHALYERPFWRARGLSGEVVSDAAAPLTVVFDNCSHDGSVAALLGFVVGRAAYGWSNRPEAARRQVVIEALARYFGPEALHPVAYVEQDWAEEPWTRGCPTANFGPGALTALGGGLRASVGRIHWAGTETAREWAGFMEGALEAGARAADEVLARAER
jgi:monoamine oxidase